MVFLFYPREIFQILKNLKPSERGEIELTQAINYGIQDRNWKFRVMRMKKNQFRGDFGNIEVYEQLSKSTKWLKKINSPNS